MYTVKALLEEATSSIGRVDAQVLICHSLGVNRASLIANPMRVLTETEDARIDMLVAQRSMGFPVAYLLGEREFYSRPFKVTSDVLIPRPETETLVEAALSRLMPHAACLDLGTGSGAIAITLALEQPGLALTATDASASALDIARANATALGATVELLQGEWYAPVAGRRFDMIVSNPPYIAAGDPHLARGDLRFEPEGALCDGSPDGLGSIHAIIDAAAAHLTPGGWLLLEHGYDQAEAVAALLSAARFAERISLPDLAGIPRVAGGKLNA